MGIILSETAVFVKFISSQDSNHFEIDFPWKQMKHKANTIKLKFISKIEKDTMQSE